MTERVGPYEITELLAAGGMAEIFLGVKPGPGGFEKPIVVKRITKRLLGDREIEAMFNDEARVQALLDHPNIVQIYDFGDDKGCLYMAMELVRGATLRWVIDNALAVRRPVPTEHALRITADVLQGLHYAHERVDEHGASLRLIHRDISPVNILVSRSGIVKLCDFGVAKSKLQSMLTRAGIVKGKFRYMAPEQLNGEAIDRRADLFAVGAVLFELLTGRRLFPQIAEDDVVAAIREGDYPAPSSVRPGIPRTIDRLVRRALQPERERRYRTAREFQLACEEALSSLGGTSNTVLLGEYVSAELDGLVDPNQPARRRVPTLENDSLLASGFEVLDPPVPSGPTVLAQPPDYSDDGGDWRRPAGVMGVLLTVLLVLPAAIFGALGLAVETLMRDPAQERDARIQLTRTRTRT